MSVRLYIAISLLAHFLFISPKKFVLSQNRGGVGRYKESQEWVFWAWEEGG